MKSSFKLGIKHLVLALALLLTFFAVYKYGQYSYYKKLPLLDGYFKTLNSDGKEGWVEVLSWQPRVFYYHHFLTDEECDHIIKLGSPSLTRSLVIGEGGKSVENPVRTSYGTFLIGSALNDPVVINVEKRLADWTQIPVENGEALYLLRYELGQEYKPHFDWFPENVEGQHWIGGAGQRMATVLMYLSDVEKGGETIFPRIGLEVAPKKGDALLWYNVHLDGKPDELTLHGGKPVLAGVKWAMTKWIRQRRAR
jgi:prolyl 4-hydroxylase